MDRFDKMLQKKLVDSTRAVGYHRTKEVTVYRDSKQMNRKDKLPEMSEDEQLKLLATDGMLVKRPLVVGEDFVLTGFREKEWEEKIRG